MRSFEEQIEIALKRDEYRDPKRPTQKQEMNLSKRSLAESGQSSQILKKPPKYPRANSMKARPKGILRRSGTSSEGPPKRQVLNKEEPKQPKESKPSQKNINYEADDLTSYFEGNNTTQNNDADTSMGHRMSVREISDDESLDELDGKFVPKEYIVEREARILRNKKKFRDGIKKKLDFDDIEDELTKPPEIDNRAKPPIYPHPQQQVIQEADENEEQTVGKSEDSSEHPPRKLPTNTSAYFAGSDSGHKSSRKPITQVESELSLRESGDEDISASAEDLASQVEGLPDSKVKKTVKFQKDSGIPGSSSEDKSFPKNEDEEFIKSLTSPQDYLNFGETYNQSVAGSVYSGTPNRNLTEKENLRKLDELYQKIKSEQISPSDLVMSNMYNDFLFHRNLITNKHQRMKIDLIFKNAFQGIETNKKDRIMISAQDELADMGFREQKDTIITRNGERVDIVNYSNQTNLLPVMDPLDYLDKKKELAKEIEIEDSNSEQEEGYKKGKLISLGFDREQDEAEKERERQAQEGDEINVGIADEAKLKEEAKQAFIRELQAEPNQKNPTASDQNQNLISQKFDEMSNIVKFNRKVEQAIAKRDNLLQLVTRKTQPRGVDEIIGEKDFNKYEPGEINELVEKARAEQELKNLKDYEAIKILQNVLPDNVETAEDLPNAITHFLNNPFEFLVYEDPQSIPQEMRDEAIEKNLDDNLNLLMNNEKYLREVNILENRTLHNPGKMSGNMLYKEYTRGAEEEFQPQKYFKLRRKNRKWYPGEEGKEEQKQDEPGDVEKSEQTEKVEDEKEEKQVEIDPEEQKRLEEEEAKRKIVPDKLKGKLLSGAGEGNDEGDMMIPRSKADSNLEGEFGKILGEIKLKDFGGEKEDYIKYLQKAVDRNRIY